MTEPEPTIESLTELAETLHWVGTRALVDRNAAIARADKAEAERDALTARVAELERDNDGLRRGCLVWQEALKGWQGVSE